MKIVLDFIKEEIKKPFEDDRKRSDKKFEDSELFYKLTKESNKTLRKGAILNSRVIAIFEKNVRMTLECGAIGDIFPSDISDREAFNRDELEKAFSVGMNLRCRVKDINFRSMIVKLSIKPTDLTNHKLFVYDYWDSERSSLLETPYFSIKPEEDYP